MIMFIIAVVMAVLAAAAFFVSRLKQLKQVSVSPFPFPSLCYWQGWPLLYWVYRQKND